MQVVCKYSGLVFKAEGFGKSEIAGVHPVFFTPFSKLEHFYSDWLRGNLSAEESRLLFLSLLNSTGLIDWTRGVPARPKDGVVQKYMERVFEFAFSCNDWRSPELKYPSYFIGPENSKLENLKLILEVWNRKRDDFYETNKRKRLHTERLELLEIKEFKLDLLVHSSSLDSKRGKGNRKLYAKRIADWAMIAGDVPEDLKEYWTSLFLLEGMDLYTARTVDLEEMVEHFEDSLDFYNSGIYAKATIDFAKKLLRENQNGILFALGEEDDPKDAEDLISRPFDFVSGDEEEDPTFRKHQTSIAAKKLAEIANSAPTTQPVRSNFSTLGAFVKATAEWKIAVRQEKERTEEAAESETELDPLF